MLKMLPLSAKKELPTDDPDLVAARKWGREAMLAADADDWSRAVVCYRRALKHAPFCTTLREEFEGALEAQIRCTLGAPPPARARSAAAAARPGLRSVAACQEDGQDDDAPRRAPADGGHKEGASVSKAPSARPQKFTPSRGARGAAPAPSWRAWGFAGGLAVLIAGGGLFAASAVTSFVGGFFGEEALPQVAAARVPQGLLVELKKAEDAQRADDLKQAREILQAAAGQWRDEEEQFIRPVLARVVRAQALQRLGSADLAAAATHFREAADLDPQNALNWIDLGKALRSQAVERSVASDPGRQREVLELAEAAFTRALALAPKDPEALYGLAKVYDSKNNRQRAVETYEQLVAVSPDSQQGRLAATNLAQLRRR